MFGKEADKKRVPQITHRLQNNECRKKEMKINKKGRDVEKGITPIKDITDKKEKMQQRRSGILKGKNQFLNLMESHYYGFSTDSNYSVSHYYHITGCFHHSYCWKQEDRCEA
jgi:hypothetical protein